MQVVRKLRSLLDQERSSSRAKEVVNLMYETALITSGFDLESPKAYASMVFEMMDAALDTSSDSIDADEIIEEGK